MFCHGAILLSQFRTKIISNTHFLQNEYLYKFKEYSVIKLTFYIKRIVKKGIKYKFCFILNKQIFYLQLMCLDSFIYKSYKTPSFGFYSINSSLRKKIEQKY
ncbi:hypothetical protein EDEG_00869 [Edhazardia aedis USNM 41457]|uniref:Uncharacterized protein n=1 Tax=Edhazardia aedis (strain USNM 41457) TaxID=1003232 RepID=J9DC14_EDHAE|nr:hypothetical protein EDEG_00869 [Edhazardia aedis USNM 41457]|eukprot:EJW05034.1 hypothetical protein EDEG_00869 [Edhazardia aedis USNM 41457]